MPQLRAWFGLVSEEKRGLPEVPYSVRAGPDGDQPGLSAPYGVQMLMLLTFVVPRFSGLKPEASFLTYFRGIALFAGADGEEQTAA